RNLSEKFVCRNDFLDFLGWEFQCFAESSENSISSEMAITHNVLGHTRELAGSNLIPCFKLFRFISKCFYSGKGRFDVFHRIACSLGGPIPHASSEGNHENFAAVAEIRVYASSPFEILSSQALPMRTAIVRPVGGYVETAGVIDAVSVIVSDVVNMLVM